MFCQYYIALGTHSLLFLACASCNAYNRYLPKAFHILNQTITKTNKWLVKSSLTLPVQANDQSQLSMRENEFNHRLAFLSILIRKFGRISLKVYKKGGNQAKVCFPRVFHLQELQSELLIYASVHYLNCSACVTILDFQATFQCQP